MKRYAIIAVALLSATAAFAQSGDPVDRNTNASQLGIDSSQQSLTEVSVDKFEQEGYWHASISSDSGFISSRLFEGGPGIPSRSATPSNPDGETSSNLAGETEAGLSILNKYVLGARVDFLRRGHASFTLKPAHPIPIEGITKTISVWVAGRNYNHKLNILIQDYFGRTFELTMGTLNFQGWKKLEVAIPPQAADGRNGIVQQNYHYNNDVGIQVIGFRVDCDPAETFGTYYIYLDDLRAVTDLFPASPAWRDSDDMADAW
ncbi:MAG: flagellar filament outer layer protein FlaA [Treponema sp.]|jgi:hypothetical protein|nr:flagellar filament outer layer protein FlaA [Treponema sp.]